MRVKADLVKEFSSVCNPREVKQMEEALTLPKNLDLKGVTLTSNQMLALKKGSEKLNQIITSVNIEGNDLNDCDLALLIGAFDKIPSIKTVNIRNMKNVGSVSIACVLNLVQKN